MKQRANRKTHHRRVQLQMVVLLLLFTLLTTLLTGWIIYDRTSEQVIRDTWQQQEALLRSACSAVNREIEQIKSFSWQLSNDNGVQRYLHLTEQTPKDILTKRLSFRYILSLTRTADYSMMVLEENPNN